jgi:hypothetical protein
MEATYGQMAPEANTRPATAGMSPAQKVAAAVLLAIGLLSAGGAAVVTAATPAPSSGTSGASGGSTQTQTQDADCPNM